MIVKCTGNSARHLTTAEAVERFNRNTNLEQVHLEIGSIYLVFGIAFRKGRPWYLICEEEGDEYPKPHLSDFFQVIDSRLPPDWSFRASKNNAGDVSVLPTPWAQDPSFLEKLVDEHTDALAFFEKLKADLAEWHRIQPATPTTRNDNPLRAKGR